MNNEPVHVTHVVQRATLNAMALAMAASENALLPTHTNLVVFGESVNLWHGFDYRRSLPLAESDFLVGDGNNLLSGVERAIELATDDPAYTPRTVIVVHADIPGEQLRAVIAAVTNTPPHIRFVFVEQTEGGATHTSGVVVVPFDTDLSEDYALTPLLGVLVA